MGHGRVFWFGFGVDEVVEHLGEAFAAGLFYVYGGGEFGDGGELALILVELDCVDEVNGRRIGGRLAAVRVRAEADGGARASLDAPSGFKGTLGMCRK